MIVDPARPTLVARNFLDGDVLGRSWDGWCDLSIECNVRPGRSIYAAERIFFTYIIGDLGAFSYRKRCYSPHPSSRDVGTKTCV